MRWSLLALLVALPALSAPALGASLQVEQILEPETSFLFVVRDMASFTEAIQSSPWKALLQDEFVQGKIHEMPDSSREELDDTADVLAMLSGMTGQAAVVADLRGMSFDESQTPRERWAILAGNENEKTIESLARKGKEKFWTTAGDVTILAGTAGYLKELESAVRNGPKGSPLGDDPAFRKLQQTGAGSDAYCYLALRPLVDMLGQSLEKAAQEEKEPDPRMTAMGVTPEGILNAMGLDAFGAVGLGVALGETETRFTCGLLGQGDRGLMKLLAYLPGPCPRLPFIPAGVVSATVARYSVPTAWDGLWELMDAISPNMAGLMQTQLDQLTMSSGVDVRQDVIGRFGETCFSAVFPRTAGEDLPQGMSDQIVGIALGEREALETSIHTLLESLGMGEAFQMREVAGTAVYGMAVPGGEASPTISFAFTDAYFLLGIGNPENMDAFLASMKAPKASIWKRPDLAPYLDQLPEDASVIGFADMGAMLSQMYAGLPQESREKLPESAWMRLVQNLGLAVTSETKTPEGLFSTMHLFHRKP